MDTIEKKLILDFIEKNAKAITAYKNVVIKNIKAGKRISEEEFKQMKKFEGQEEILTQLCILCFAS